jgi:hypothetical protein
LPEVWVVEPHNQADQRRLALAGLTYDCNIILGIDFEIKALKYPLVAPCGVPEPDILEFYFAAEFLWYD